MIRFLIIEVESWDLLIVALANNSFKLYSRESRTIIVISALLTSRAFLFPCHSLSLLNYTFDSVI